jgi:hypothetical protein
MQTRRTTTTSYRSRRAWTGRIVFAVMAACGIAGHASADTITFSGTISQPQDQTNPASNNPALNNIQLNDVYSVAIDFLGSVTSTGLHPLSLVTMTFLDSPAGVSETSFNSASVTVSADGSLYDLSILGCLATGSGCAVGNQLDANFSIPMADLNAHGVIAQAIPGLVPSMDLLEDDGSTDIQGSVTGYDYSGSVEAATPEPSEIVPLSAVMAALLWLQLRRRRAPNEIRVSQKGEKQA